MTAVSRILLALALAAGPARAYETNFAGSYWVNAPVTVRMDVSGATAEGSADSTALAAAVRAAAARWNAVLRLPLIQIAPASLPDRAAGNGLNELVFSTKISPTADFASQFGSVAERRAGNGRLLECDLIFNPAHRWLVYRGALRHETNGDRVPDLYRVALHEFGHLLGIEHPDSDAPFTVMRSAMSDVDDLTAHDVRDGRLVTEALMAYNRPRIAAPSAHQSTVANRKIRLRGTAAPFFVRRMIVRVASSGSARRVTLSVGKTWRKTIALREGRNRLTFSYRTPFGKLTPFAKRVVVVR